MDAKCNINPITICQLSQAPSRAALNVILACCCVVHGRLRLKINLNALIVTYANGILLHALSALYAGGLSTVERALLCTGGDGLSTVPVIAGNAGVEKHMPLSCWRIMAVLPAKRMAPKTLAGPAPHATSDQHLYL